MSYFVSRQPYLPIWKVHGFGRKRPFWALLLFLTDMLQPSTAISAASFGGHICYYKYLDQIVQDTFSIFPCLSDIISVFWHYLNRNLKEKKSVLNNIMEM
jgi:hypothetical protein